MVEKPCEYDLTFFDNKKMTTKDTHYYNSNFIQKVGSRRAAKRRSSD